MPCKYNLQGLKEFPIFQTLNGNHRRSMLNYLAALNPVKAAALKFLVRVYSEKIPAQTAWSLASLANMEGTVVHTNTFWETIKATRQVKFKNSTIYFLMYTIEAMVDIRFSFS